MTENEDQRTELIDGSMLFTSRDRDGVHHVVHVAVDGNPRELMSFVEGNARAIHARFTREVTADLTTIKCTGRVL